MLNIVKQLVSVAPRYGINEIKAVQIICQLLENNHIVYEKQMFNSAVPQILEAKLQADGKEIPCIGSSLVSGEIKDGSYLISSLGYVGEKHPYNICYSPITDEISVVDIHRDEPSVTISRKDIIKIVMASKVNGYVKVKKTEFETANILIGNTINPDNLIFAHFDSIIGNGAMDNAAAVAVVLQTILENQTLLNNNLFILAGNEEVSYDNYKTKSGFGFRVFESKYQKLLKNCKQVVVLDGVGIGKSQLVQFGLDWVLQVRCLDQIKNKVWWLQNDQRKVLQYFHTKADTIENLKLTYLEAAKSTLINKIR